jgi:hypothetical protein
MRSMLPYISAGQTRVGPENLCSVFQQLAVSTWDKMGAAHCYGMPLNEETITENLLLELAIRCPMQIKVIPFTKKRENTNGADWEWWFWVGEKAIGCRVQAKKLDSSTARYEALKYKPKGQSQIDKLVSVAATDRLVPMYCFYAFMPRQNPFIDFLKNPLQACSLAHATSVSKANTKQGRTIQAVSYPWHELVCAPDFGQPTLDAIAAKIRLSCPGGGTDEEIIQELPDHVRDLTMIRLRAAQAEDMLKSRDKLGRAYPVRGIVTIRVGGGQP